jgi:uncharacterized protein YidB (DUF937 family)
MRAYAAAAEWLLACTFRSGANMANDFMGQILGHVLGGAGQSAPAGGSGLGGVLGEMLGAGGANAGAPAAGQRGALMTMLLPLAMEWVQRSGGIGGVLGRFQQKGFGPQANSWVANGPNQALAPQQVGEVVGQDELARIAQRLGVDQQQVAGGLAEILPKLVDHATPNGQVTPQSDQQIAHGRLSLEQALAQLGAPTR